VQKVKDLQDKVAVVTGGASGIGLGIGRALAAEGCHVVVADLDKTAADKAAEELSQRGVKSLAVVCDVTNNTDIENLCVKSWETFGHVDLLFNNAGVGGELASLVDTTENSLRWIFEVNVFGAWKVCKAFTQRFIEQATEAHIINTGSENSIASPIPMTAAYNATKHAMLGFSGILRMELPDFISLSVLCPGLVSTNLANGGRHRPEKFGGVTPPMFKDRPTPGTDPDELGLHTVARVKQGDFYIVTHACVRELVEERYTELLQAFDEQAPYYEGCEELSTRSILGEAIKAQQEKDNSILRKRRSSAKSRKRGSRLNCCDSGSLFTRRQL
jgi:NAD(P)-dependent dehydrogenase (short-subunit alcohol dehydrogenase family)